MFKSVGPMPAFRAGTLTLRGLVALSAVLALSACTVQWQNTQPAKEMAAEKARPPGSVYTGWRVFQDKCATCHGGDAMGTARGADLTQRLRGLGQREFVGLVLQRYDWGIPKPGADAAAREAQIAASWCSGTIAVCARMSCAG